MKTIIIILQSVFLFTAVISMIYDWVYRSQVLETKKRLKMGEPISVDHLLTINSLISIVSVIIMVVILANLLQMP